MRARAVALAGAVVLICFLGGAQADDPRRYADEDRDWGVAPTRELRLPPYHAPTPREIPGARVVHTHDLQALLRSADRPLLIDVLSGEGHETLAGALWLGGAGRGEALNDGVQASLVRLLAGLTGGDRAKPMAFFCAGAQCWLSYNAALRAVAAGYTRVYWYRGGIDAWTEAQFPTGRTVARDLPLDLLPGSRNSGDTHIR